MKYGTIYAKVIWSIGIALVVGGAVNLFKTYNPWIGIGFGTLIAFITGFFMKE